MDKYNDKKMNISYVHNVHMFFCQNVCEYLNNKLYLRHCNNCQIHSYKIILSKSRNLIFKGCKNAMYLTRMPKGKIAKCKRKLTNHVS